MSKPSIFADEGLVVATDGRGGIRVFRVTDECADWGDLLDPDPSTEALNLDASAAEWLASALLNHARVARAERRAKAVER